MEYQILESTMATRLYQLKKSKFCVKIGNNRLNSLFYYENGSFLASNFHIQTAQ